MADAPVLETAQDGFLHMLQVTGAVLVLLLLAGYLALLLLRRFARGSWMPGKGKGPLRVVDYVPLGGKRALVVARLHDHVMVLGLGSDSVELLADFAEEEIEAEHGIDRALRAAASRAREGPR